MSYTGINKGVFSKLPSQEVELSAEKVELQSVADIERIRKGVIEDINRLDAEKTKLNDLQSQYFNAQREYKKNVGLTEAGIGLLEKAANDFAKKASELGLGNQPIVTGALNEAKSLKAKMKSHTDNAKRIK